MNFFFVMQMLPSVLCICQLNKSWIEVHSKIVSVREMCRIFSCHSLKMQYSRYSHSIYIVLKVITTLWVLQLFYGWVTELADVSCLQT